MSDLKKTPKTTTKKSTPLKKSTKVTAKKNNISKEKTIIKTSKKVEIPTENIQAQTTKITKTIQSDPKPADANLKISFNQYKREATINDIQTMQVGLKPRHWENIPIVGCFGYMVRIALRNSAIDRGPLRREIVKFQMIFTFGMLPPIFGLCCMLTPWLLYAPHALALKRTKEIIAKDEL